MKARKSENVDIDVIDESDDSQENPTKSTSTMRLERRRRIEDLDEERRLREELSEF